MGCDYYTWIETVITWIDESGNYRQYINKPSFEEYERNYSFRDDYKRYDPDFEDPPDFDQELKDAIYNYGTNYLFNNGEWMCKEAGKQRILKLCEEQKIPVERIEKVFKRMDGYWR